MCWTVDKNVDRERISGFGKGWTEIRLVSECWTVDKNVDRE